MRVLQVAEGHKGQEGDAGGIHWVLVADTSAGWADMGLAGPGWEEGLFCGGNEVIRVTGFFCLCPGGDVTP